jgi:hypothetical protein
LENGDKGAVGRKMESGIEGLGGDLVRLVERAALFDGRAVRLGPRVAA